MQTSEQKLKYLHKTIETLWHGVEDTKTGDYPRIINLYKEVLKLNPKDRDAWENMIWLMWSLSINTKDSRWLDDAEIFSKRYLSLMPNGYRSYEYLGMFYRMMKKDEKLSIRYYEGAIRFKDCPVTTFHSLVSLCIKNNDRLNALGYTKQGLSRFKNDAYLNSKLLLLK
jgi:tetratricopeptide (TPR) repeat protein